MRQRVAMWCRTKALTAEQTGAYIQERLSIAGTTTRIFSKEAVHAIHAASKGIPRLINLICEHALIFGYVEQLHEVPAGIIFAVAQDLDLETLPFVVSGAQAGIGANK